MLALTLQHFQFCAEKLRQNSQRSDIHGEICGILIFAGFDVSGKICSTKTPK